MATQADVRRIALSLPETEEGKSRFSFFVRNKGKLKGDATKFFTEPWLRVHVP